MEDLHVRIRRWREAAGLNQAQLAEKCGVTPAAVCYWESSSGHGPATDRLSQIASACGISLRIFFGDLPKQPPEAA